MLSFTYEKLKTGTRLSEKDANEYNVGKVHLRSDCADGSIVNITRQSILFSFSISARLGRETFKEPSCILFQEMNKDKIDKLVSMKLKLSFTNG